MAKIRLGLVGCGHMMGIHAKAVNDCTEEMEITAVCDVIRENAAKVAEALNTPIICTDYRDLLDHVDAVLIALPHDLHYACGMFFARNKKHIKSPGECDPAVAHARPTRRWKCRNTLRFS